jgi:hypothetical protein
MSHFTFSLPLYSCTTSSSTTSCRHTKILFVSSTMRIKRWVEKQGGYVPAGRPVSKILRVYSHSVQMACACKLLVQPI